MTMNKFTTEQIVHVADQHEGVEWIKATDVASSVEAVLTMLKDLKADFGKDVEKLLETIDIANADLEATKNIVIRQLKEIELLRANIG